MRIDVALQPIVNLAHQATVGYEALFRAWHPPDHLLGPRDVFDNRSPEAIRELELQVYLQALEVRQRLFASATLFLNIHLGAFAGNPDAYAAVLGGQKGVVLELGEREMGHVSELVSWAQGMGLQIALEDFGVGYSNLDRMLELRPACVKLDRSIVAGISLDPRRQRIVHCIRDSVSDAGATLVAEGVESESDATWLRRASLPLAQGFYFGKPVLASQLQDDLCAGVHQHSTSVPSRPVA